MDTAATKLAGQTVELLVPQGLRDQHAAERTGYAAKPCSRKMGMHPDLTLSGLRKDGSTFPVEIALIPIDTAGTLYSGSGVLVYAAVRDMTERMRMEEALRENLSQLLAAQRIQEHLLPNHPPVLPGFDIAGALHPAEFAAGDHFDFLAMPEQCLGVLVADVTPARSRPCHPHGFDPCLPPLLRGDPRGSR